MLNHLARVLRGSRLLIIILLFAGSALAQAQTVVFDGQTFRISGWPDAGKYPQDRLAEFLSVSVDAPNVPSLSGQYRVENGELAFIPRYPLGAGLVYRADVRLPSKTPFSKTFETPKA